MKAVPYALWAVLSMELAVDITEEPIRLSCPAKEVRSEEAERSDIMLTAVLSRGRLLVRKRLWIST